MKHLAPIALAFALLGCASTQDPETLRQLANDRRADLNAVSVDARHAYAIGKLACEYVPDNAQALTDLCDGLDGAMLRLNDAWLAAFRLVEALDAGMVAAEQADAAIALVRDAAGRMRDVAEVIKDGAEMARPDSRSAPLGRGQVREHSAGEDAEGGSEAAAQPEGSAGDVGAGESEAGAAP